MSHRVLVAGIGNIFLGDDGFGSQVAQRLGRLPLPENVTVTDYGIRGMHLAYDLLAGCDALVIVDATPHDAEPGTLIVMAIGADDLGAAELDAHGMQPTAVLSSLGALGGELPPTYLVGCQPADVTEGIGLTPVVADAIDPAIAAVLELIADDLGAGAAHPPSVFRKEHQP